MSISTIRDFESGRRQCADRNLWALRSTLERHVVFVFEDAKYGPGVKLAKGSIVIVKPPREVGFASDTLPFTVRWRSRDVFAFLPRKAVEGLAGRKLSDQECLSEFSKRYDTVLSVVARAIYAGLVDEQNRLFLHSRHFTGVAR